MGKKEKILIKEKGYFDITQGCHEIISIKILTCKMWVQSSLELQQYHNVVAVAINENDTNFTSKSVFMISE